MLFIISLIGKASTQKHDREDLFLYDSKIIAADEEFAAMQRLIV